MRLPLQIRNVQYNAIGYDAVLSPPSGKQLHIYEAKLTNGSAGTVDMALMRRLSPDTFNFYNVVAADTPDATLNNAIKSGVSTTLFTIVNNDGFLIQCSERFGAIGFVLDAASAGATLSLLYFNGSAYVALASATLPVLTSTGKIVFYFVPPFDWVPGTTAAVGGATDQYSILVRATTHPTTAVSATEVQLLAPLDSAIAVPAKGELNTTFFAFQPLVLNGNDAIVPYFGAAAATNLVRITYSIQE